ncbi:hypothetical protein [Noviherbaspirillum suwonense]|uniref:Uncharacterized protein n=1 Tax=Noviherbaspirillum suwonense TaxID=1224511 RepID=A0ABY1QWX2_9BURK|nr:hypothetical protein [Noviherbaspirillum suwonense]SMP80185.1 hypothetical protein SAMN06295970_13435 [Noviherbaspirillum suwonense]
MVVANTAVEMGLDMLGYADVSKIGGQATPSARKLKQALLSYPEGRAEILLASLFLEMQNATSLDDVRKVIPNYERLVDTTAAAI